MRTPAPADQLDFDEALAAAMSGQFLTDTGLPAEVEDALEALSRKLIATDSDIARVRKVWADSQLQ